MKLKEFRKRYSPPGKDMKSESFAYTLMLVLSSIFSLGFFVGYREARAMLYEYDRLNNKYFLRENAVIADFNSITEITFMGFIILSVVSFVFIIFRYTYYRQDSMSIYLMKRLPDRFEIHKRALIIPVILSSGSLICAFVIRSIYFLIYVIATPKQCLPLDVWQQLWRIIQ